MLTSPFRTEFTRINFFGLFVHDLFFFFTLILLRSKGINKKELMSLEFLPCALPLVHSDIFMYYRFINCPHVVLGQFVCIAQQDYWRILNHVEKNTHKVEEKEKLLWYMSIVNWIGGTRKGHIVIKVSVFYLLFLSIE